jgi:hypothetical protein
LPWIVGTPSSNPDAFIYDPCHGHYHYLGFAGTYLFDEDLQLVEFARKTQYAVFDMQCLPWADPQYWGGQALSPGCSDIYGTGTACQWVDITDIDTGHYTMVSGVNWDRVPDNAGHYEKTYENNFEQVCLYIFENAQGEKDFIVEQIACPIFIDCAGDTFGIAQLDCAGICNGTAMRGDLNADLERNETDLGLYLTYIAGETIQPTTCNDLTGEGSVTVLDAARLNGCLRFEDSTHYHPNGWPNSHDHCVFPMNVYNPYDTVTFSIENFDPVAKSFDLSILNPSCLVLGYELVINGAVISDVEVLAGNYSPQVEFNPAGRVVVLSVDEFSLNKNLVVPLQVLRVYYETLNGSEICVNEVVDVVNSNYEQITGVSGSCVATNVGIEAVPATTMHVYPNPNTGWIDLTVGGTALNMAQIELFDNFGNLVHAVELQSTNNHSRLDLTALPDGVYLLKFRNENITMSRYIVLMK